MPTDPTAPAYRKAFPEPGVTIRPGGGGGGGSGMPHGVGGFTGSVILDATKPMRPALSPVPTIGPGGGAGGACEATADLAPDYRAELEALVDAYDAILAATCDNLGSAFAAHDRALTHARKVLHGQ